MPAERREIETQLEQKANRIIQAEVEKNNSQKILQESLIVIQKIPDFTVKPDNLQNALAVSVGEVESLKIKLESLAESLEKEIAKINEQYEKNMGFVRKEFEEYDDRFEALKVEQEKTQKEMDIIRNSLKEALEKTKENTHKITILENSEAFKLELKREGFKKSFSGYPVILQFYNRLYVVLEAIFICAKGTSGPFGTPNRGFLGELADLLELGGEVLNAIPFIGGAAKLIAATPVKSFLSKIDRERQKNMVTNISNLGVLDDLKKISESIARRLSEMYRDQLIRLDVEKNDGEKSGFKAKMTAFFQQVNWHALNKKEISIVEKFADLGILKMLNMLVDGNFDKLDTLENKFIKVVFCEKNSSLSTIFCKALGLKDVTNENGGWFLEDIYSQPGIKTADGKEYSSSNRNPLVYGYCYGTKEEANFLGLELVPKKTPIPNNYVVQTNNVVQENQVRTHMDEVNNNVRPIIFSRRNRNVNRNQYVNLSRLEVEEQGIQGLSEPDKFLWLVMKGRKDAVENMLITNGNLALVYGNIDRGDIGFHFRGITGFQCALWSLNTTISLIIMQYMSREEARRQYEEMECKKHDRDSWCHRYKIQADEKDLIKLGNINCLFENQKGRFIKGGPVYLSEYQDDPAWKNDISRNAFRMFVGTEAAVVLGVFFYPALMVGYAMGGKEYCSYMLELKFKNDFVHKLMTVSRQPTFFGL